MYIRFIIEMAWVMLFANFWFRRCIIIIIMIFFFML